MIDSDFVISGCMRWGKWGANFSTQQYLTLIHKCIDCDITTFDHADIYGNYTTEAEFGVALKNNISLRQKIKLITKSGIQLVCNERPQHKIKSYNTSKSHIINSVEQSLKLFHSDYIDIFLIHRPNPLLNPNEVAEAITILKQQGKILQFGVSNFLPTQVNLLKKFISIEYNQVEASVYNVTNFDNGVFDNCLKHEINPMAWGILGGGNIDDNKEILNVVHNLAEKHTATTTQILVAFLYKHPANILPIAGTTKIERLIEIKAAKNILLSDEDWFQLYSAAKGTEVD